MTGNSSRRRKNEGEDEQTTKLLEELRIRGCKGIEWQTDEVGCVEGWGFRGKGLQREGASEPGQMANSYRQRSRGKKGGVRRLSLPLASHVNWRQDFSVNRFVFVDQRLCDYTNSYAW